MPSTTASPGRFAADKLKTTLHAACARVGLDPTGAELIHITVNALYRLRSAPVVVRIAGSRTLLPRVHRLIQVARWLEQQDFPAVRLTAGINQPVIVDETDHVVTFWDYLPQDGQSMEPRDLAEPLRRLHTLPPPSFPLPTWDPIREARRRLAAAHHLDAQHRAWLEHMAEEVERELPCVPYVLPRAVIHGDAYVGNLLRDRQGRPVLCDLDAVSIGPPEWDLVPTAVAYLRFGKERSFYQDLADTYGFDVLAWEGFPSLRKARELNVLTGVLPALTSSPGIAAEFTHRMEGLRAGREDTWTPFRYAWANAHT
ncbi:hypothetical protein TH66_03250 [Carbonactinospora thermoautotrophica]|uniref:Aminoglycoside phosphotransferase n=1 Tax=Carbonactinospora thermoautotrophica TaxID=1469144 RepID=A0A132N5L5_9ACTN|nr:aminoglycoside phosphotransferase family protein [Carbonactinospora thermoautotrophica]KWX00762.1 Aminoglycoside phosphotransferase [Carbonactinospora thermoautotrophica]KWX05277.1 hypothetical protein TH66_03250 [Carbonactinospora thermoautotrophica]KWX09062.1 hypothetical protein TR74_11865 [Carbonactinospora thermoautotrophica]